MVEQTVVKKPTKTPEKKKIKKEKKETSIVARTQQKLEKLKTREDKLTALVEKKRAHIAKLQAVLKRFEDKLEKTKAEREAEVKSIEALVKAFQNA